MLSLKNFFRKLKSPFYYNIGFVNISSKEFIEERGFRNRKIEWLRHKYKDRWFADPFILDVNENYITTLVEEKPYGKPGRIVKLIISKKDKKLIDRKLILELDTHLSYPIIFQKDKDIYIYPENSQSKRLSAYKLSQDSEIKSATVLINRSLNDSTIIWDSKSKNFYMLSTDSDIDFHNFAQLFKAKDFLGPWDECGNNPVVTDIKISRPGGNFFVVNNDIFRPAQDCYGLYGNSLHIMKVESFEPYKETEFLHIKPNSYKYSHGLHTLNFHNSGIAVLDGNGYAYPLFGRLFGKIIEFICHPKKLFK